MYIPIWVLIIVIVIIYFVYGKKSKKITVEVIETQIPHLKERIFSLERFDSPHFLDVQNAFDAMEVNYLRLKQRNIHLPEKVLEIAEDWKRYVESLGDLKYARVMLDVDLNEGAWDRAEENMKEPSIVKIEIEKKFKSLLGEDWQKIPPDYFKRIENMKKSDKKNKAK